MKAQKKEEAFDIYGFINDQIVQRLEQGVIPWRKPWKVAIVDGQQYSIPHITTLPSDHIAESMLFYLHSLRIVRPCS